MEDSYVKSIVENTNEFCDIFNNYEDELKNLGEKIDSISKEIDDYNKSVTENGNASAQSYDALDDSRKYHDIKGNVIPYDNLTVTQKRGLTKEIEFVADREIELHDKMDEANYNMKQSANKFVKELQDKTEEIRRSNNHLSQLNLQYISDMARNQIVIDDCLHDMTRVNTIDEKREIANRRMQALKDNRKTELTLRINTALINATNLLQGFFSSVIDTMKTTITSEFENVDDYNSVIHIEEKMDIMSELNKLMTSFSNIKNEFDKEKELITSINEKCKAMKKATEDKDVKTFINGIMKTTKEFSDLIEDIEKYNKKSEESKEFVEKNDKSSNKLENNGQENDGPENNEPENNGQENDGPENNGPENDGPENNGPENDGPENNGPENDGPENDELDESIERKNQDIEYNVNRKRQSNAAKRGMSYMVCACALAAANGLGIAPIVGSLATAGLIGTGALSIGSAGWTAYQRRSATHKLKKIAKEMRKVGFNIRLGKFDYEKGIVNYIYTDEFGQESLLKDVDQSVLDSRRLNMLINKLDKSFRNDQRGLHEAARKTSIFETNMKDMPRVTIDNLEAAYAPIGGIRSLKDDVLGEAFSWDTNPKFLAKIKDMKFIRNIRNKEEKPVEEVSIEDIAEEQNGPVVEEDVDEEVTPQTQQDTPVTPDVETNEQTAPNMPTQEPQQDISIIPDVETNEQTVPDMSTQEPQASESTSEIPNVDVEISEKSTGDMSAASDNESSTDQNKEQDLLTELYNPSKEMYNSSNGILTDDEISMLLSDLENASSIEQGVKDIASAAEEQTDGKVLGR